MGRSRTSGSRRRAPAINVTPLVDVLLILVVLLMLASPLMVKQLPVQLPATSLDARPLASSTLRVSVAADGTVFIDETQTSFAHLMSQVTPQTSVELRLDEDLSYRQVAILIAELHERGPRDIMLVTR